MHLTHWQYWFWFWFTYFFVLYYLLFLKLLRSRVMKFQPKLATTFLSRGKWGDLIVCLLPLSWCANILSNSNFILRMLEWQSESSLFTLRVRGRQWYWLYRYEIKETGLIGEGKKAFGAGHWVGYTSNILAGWFGPMGHLSGVKEVSLLTHDSGGWVRPLALADRGVYTTESVCEEATDYSKYIFRPSWDQHTKSFGNRAYRDSISFSRVWGQSVWLLKEGVSTLPDLVNYPRKTTPFPEVFTPVLSALPSGANPKWGQGLFANKGYRAGTTTLAVLRLNIDNSRITPVFKRVDSSTNLPTQRPYFFNVKQERSGFQFYKNIRGLWVEPRYGSLDRRVNQFVYDSEGKKLPKQMSGRRALYQSRTSLNFDVLDSKNSRRLLRTKYLLVVPCGVNLTLITNSFDVVHSWYVPGLGIKLDCVPGRSTHHTLHINHAGFYYGQCAEICGRYHHHMPIRVCALPFEHFVMWWGYYVTPALYGPRLSAGLSDRRLGW